MSQFRMTDEIATILFTVKNGMLYWSHSDAVYEPVRGKRVGSASTGHNITTVMGNGYATADIVYLIEHGEWPAYEEIVTKSGMLSSRFKGVDRKPMTREQAELFAERIEIIERELQERYENF